MKRVSFVFLVFTPLCLPAQQVRVIGLKELDQLTQQDKNTITVVNFWATWCKPCLEELPVFQTIDQNYRQRGVKVLLVSLDFADQQNKVSSFIQSKGIISPVFILDEPDPDSWISKIDSSWSGALPATLLLNGEKRAFFERKIELSEIDSFIKQSLP